MAMRYDDPYAYEDEAGRPRRQQGFMAPQQKAAVAPAQPQQPAAFDYQAFKGWNGGWGGGTAADLQNWVASNPYAQGHVTVGGKNGDLLYLPGGEVIDARIGASQGGTAYGWTRVTPGASGGGSGQGAGAGTGAAPAVDPAVAAKQAADRARGDELYNLLLGRATQSLAIDRHDPTIRGQADAFAANQERARRNYLGDLAERSGPIANLRGEARMTAEQVGQATGGFEAELMGRELTARRAEIQAALDGMRGMLTTEQQLALQRELGYLDDATRRLGIDVQREGIGLDWQKAMLQNEQFNKRNDLDWFNSWNQWDPRFRNSGV